MEVAPDLQVSIRRETLDEDGNADLRDVDGDIGVITSAGHNTPSGLGETGS
jgi:hypothetical protein